MIFNNQDYFHLYLKFLEKIKNQLQFLKRINKLF